MDFTIYSFLDLLNDMCKSGKICVMHSDEIINFIVLRDLDCPDCSSIGEFLDQLLSALDEDHLIRLYNDVCLCFFPYLIEYYRGLH